MGICMINDHCIDHTDTVTACGTRHGSIRIPEMGTQINPTSAKQTSRIPVIDIGNCIRFKIVTDRYWELHNLEHFIPRAEEEFDG
jgi:hypothetical protein